MKIKNLSCLAALLIASLFTHATPGVDAQRRRAPQRKPGAVKRETPPPSTPPPAAETSSEIDRSVEELLSVENYGVYVEARNVGRLLMSAALREAIGALALIDPEANKSMELVNFAAANEDVLAGARAFAATLPTRAELPEGLLALQLSSPESARAFEPVLRAFLSEQAKASTVVASDEKAPKKRGARTSKKSQVSKREPPPTFTVRRAGSWLLSSDKPFTVRALRGDGRNLLANNRRYQTMRNRFASESVFVYIDVERAQKGWGALMKDMEEGFRIEEEERAAKVASANKSEEEFILGAPDGPVVAETEAVGPRAASSPTPAPGEPLVEIVAPVVVGEETGTMTQAPPPPPPTEEQLAVGRFDQLFLGSLFGGVMRLPGAVAAGASLDGDSFVLKVAVESMPGFVNVIPFLPNVISGPPVTVETSAVAPADAEVFIAGSLDWQRMFDALLNTAKESEKGVEAALAANPDAMLADVEDGKPVSTEATIATIEKLFGFKFKGELLPALGNEIALSMPLDLFNAPRFNPPVGEDEEETKPGPVVMLALNNPEVAQRTLPRLFAVMGYGATMTPTETEKREGFEIASSPAFSYAFVNDFLLLGYDARHVRHAVESFAHGRTLAHAEGYRDATAWQQPQRLLHVYVADELMRGTIKDARKAATGSTDPVVLAALTRLDIKPEPAALATVNEGDALLHELRLPVGLFKAFAVAGIIGSKEGPLLAKEMSALYALQFIYEAQRRFREDDEHERYATFEELKGANFIDDAFIKSAREGYKIEVVALGDRFEATATPVEYGVTGRRSFYVDQTGVMRGADHKGRPATAQDPPVED